MVKLFLILSYYGQFPIEPFLFHDNSQPPLHPWINVSNIDGVLPRRFNAPPDKRGILLVLL